MHTLNLNVERWSMIEKDSSSLASDFSNFDLMSVVDNISPATIEVDNQPWNYNSFDFVKPQGGH